MAGNLSIFPEISRQQACTGLIESNRSGQHVLIVLSDSPHHAFAHSGSRTIVQFENVTFPS